MNVRLRHALLTLALGGLLAAGAGPARASGDPLAEVHGSALAAPVETAAPQATPHGSKNAPSAEQTPVISNTSFQLTVSLAPPQPAAAEAGPCLVVGVRSPEGTLIADRVSGVLLLWTTPSGKTLSMPLRPVDTGQFASLVSPGAEQGTHRLRIDVLVDGAARQVSRVVEIQYELQLPTLILTRMDTSELGEAGAHLKSAPVAAPVREVEVRHGPSAGACVVIFFLLNVFVIGGLLAAGQVVRHLPPSLKTLLAGPLRRLRRMLPAAHRNPDLQALYDSGLLEEDGTVEPPPVAFDPEKMAKEQIVDDPTIDPVKLAPDLTSRAQTELLIQKLNDGEELLAAGDDEPLEPVGEPALVGAPGKETPLDLNDLSF